MGGGNSETQAERPKPLGPKTTNCAELRRVCTVYLCAAPVRNLLLRIGKTAPGHEEMGTEFLRCLCIDLSTMIGAEFGKLRVRGKGCKAYATWCHADSDLISSCSIRLLAHRRSHPSKTTASCPVQVRMLPSSPRSKLLEVWRNLCQNGFILLVLCYAVAGEDQPRAGSFWVCRGVNSAVGAPETALQLLHSMACRPICFSCELRAAEHSKEEPIKESSQENRAQADTTAKGFGIYGSLRRNVPLMRLSYNRTIVSRSGLAQQGRTRKARHKRAFTRSALFLSDSACVCRPCLKPRKLCALKKTRHSKKLRTHSTKLD